MNNKHSTSKSRKCLKCNRAYRQMNNFLVHFKKEHLHMCMRKRCSPRKLCETCIIHVENAKREWKKKKDPNAGFKRISVNRYSEKLTEKLRQDDIQCECQVSCDSNCLNRRLFLECNPRKCKFGQFCENTEIQNRRANSRLNIEIFATEKKGIGVKAKQLIEEGSYIAEYVGEVRKEQDFLESMRTTYTNEIHHYCMKFEKGLVIDAYRMGNIIRYVNHSCDPNCEIQKWTVNGLPRMALYSIKRVEINEELSYDYKFVRFNAVQRCYCQSKNCRGSL